jgi:uncharacterized protein (TIGR04255 family)
MSVRIPVHLQQEPLIEVAWEIRFGAKDNLPLGQMLPGLLYQAFKTEFPQITRLPTADIPLPIAKANEMLAYLPSFRLEAGPDLPFVIQIGERMVSLNNRRPYVGWSGFRARVESLIEQLQKTGLIKQPERFSLKYANLLQRNVLDSLAGMNVALQLAGRDLISAPMQLRAELHLGDLIHVVQIMNPVDVVLGGNEKLSGVLIDIDTVGKGGEDLWDRLMHDLDVAHEQSKQLFFDLLCEQTLNRLEPVYT